MKDPRTTQWLTRSDGLATRLRRARGSRPGLQLANALGWQSSKVSRIELGTQIPTEEDIEAWAAQTGLDEVEVGQLKAMLEEVRSMRGVFRQRAKAGQASIQGEYNDLISASTLIRFFNVTAIPGILQVPEYARQILLENVTVYGVTDDVEAALAKRMQRQAFLYDATRRFEIILDQSTLVRRSVPPAVMRAQLDRLLSVAGIANVRFGILPNGPTLHMLPPASSFGIYDDLVIVEAVGGDDKYRGDDSDLLVRIMDLLWEDAVEDDEARRLILDAIEALPPD